MPQSLPLMAASAAHARAIRTHDPSRIATARMAFEEAKIRAWTERTLASAPNLRPETVATLTRLLAVVGEQ